MVWRVRSSSSSPATTAAIVGWFVIVEHESGDAMLHHLGHTPDWDRHHRTARHERLDGDTGDALRLTGEHHEIHPAEHPFDVGPVSEERDGPAEAEQLDPCVEVGA